MFLAAVDSSAVAGCMIGAGSGGWKEGSEGMHRLFVRSQIQKKARKLQKHGLVAEGRDGCPACVIALNRKTFLMSSKDSRSDAYRPAIASCDSHTPVKFHLAPYMYLHL